MKSWKDITGIVVIFSRFEVVKQNALEGEGRGGEGFAPSCPCIFVYSVTMQYICLFQKTSTELFLYTVINSQQVSECVTLMMFT